MHYSRIAAFLLGALVLGSLFMAFVATENFQTVNEMLKSPPPPAEQMIRTLGAENARLLLRHLAGEENRLFFQNWEVAQLALGLALLAFLLVGGKSRILLGLAAAIVALTIFQHFRITSELVWQGRSIDFVPAAAESTARQHFGKLHAAYGVIEAAKLLLMLAIAGFLFPYRRRRQHIQIDAIDYANHGHVDG